MKTVKIVLGIVTAITLTFLLTGLFVSEVTYSADIEIDKPVNEVFENFTNVELMKKWLPDIKSIEPIEEKSDMVGSTYTIIAVNNGQEMKMIQKITAFIPNEKITYRFDSDQMIKTDEFNFIANGNKTKLVQNCSVNSKSYITACLFPYFKSKFKELSLSYMKQLKTEVEK